MTRTRSTPLVSPISAASATVLAVALSGADNARAQAVTNGAQFQINTYTSGDQRDSTVAVDGQGRFVVSWFSPFSSGNDNSSGSIQCQRFASGGTPLGGEIQVNAVTGGSQLTPAIAASALGGFVVVWTSETSGGSDAYGTSIQGQRFDSAGNSAGAQFQVNSYTSGDQLDPAVSADADGNFVVVWQSYGSSGGDTSYSSVQGQRFESTGAPQGAQFQVNTYTTLTQYTPRVASDADGNFVVVWSSGGSAGTDNASYSVQARRFLADGSALGGDFQVNSYTTSDQTYPAVAVDGLGRFVVTWEGAGSSGNDNASGSIHARRFDSGGNALAAEIQVNSYTANDQRNPSIASDDLGNVVIVWGSTGSSGTDTSMSSVQAQRYRADGSALGGQFQVNTYTSSGQFSPAVASDSDGNFVVTWDSQGSTSTDFVNLSIQGQRFDAVFREDFESGVLTRWTAKVP